MALDLGVGGYIEKFEEHFGRGWTKVLLIFIGLIIVSLGAPVIWSLLFKPLIEAVAGFMPGQETKEAKDFGKFIVFVALVLAGINYAIGIFDRRLQIKITRQYGLRIAKAKDALDDVERQLSEARAELETAQKRGSGWSPSD